MFLYYTIQCPKLRVHPAPGVHISTAGCTILGGVHPVCARFLGHVLLLYIGMVHGAISGCIVLCGVHPASAQNKSLISDTEVYTFGKNASQLCFSHVFSNFSRIFAHKPYQNANPTHSVIWLSTFPSPQVPVCGSSGPPCCDSRCRPLTVSWARQSALRSSSTEQAASTGPSLPP